MSTMVTRVKLIDILGENAISFMAWINGPDPEAKIILKMLEMSQNIDLENPMFQTVIIPMLENKGLVDTFVKERIQAEIDHVYSRHSFI